jgi:hypothetical protein
LNSNTCGEEPVFGIILTYLYNRRFLSTGLELINSGGSVYTTCRKPRLTVERVGVKINLHKGRLIHI